MWQSIYACVRLRAPQFVVDVNAFDRIGNWFFVEIFAFAQFPKNPSQMVSAVYTVDCSSVRPSICVYIVSSICLSCPSTQLSWSCPQSHTHTLMYLYMGISVFVYVCVCIVYACETSAYILFPLAEWCFIFPCLRHATISFTLAAFRASPVTLKCVLPLTLSP